MSADVTTFDPATAVTVTEAAARHFEAKLLGAGQSVVRLDIKTSGCTGYAYVLDAADQALAGDTLIPLNPRVSLAVSAQALPVIRGTQIDYVLEGVNRVIKYNNPNVSAECGCGESFSVD